MDNRSWMSRLRACHALVLGLVLVRAASPVEAQAEASPNRPIRIRLDAGMTVMQAGEAIRRGIILAIDEINAPGGALGRPLELVLRDIRGNPARGMDNIEELAQLDASDYRLFRYSDGGAIVPMAMP